MNTTKTTDKIRPYADRFPYNVEPAQRLRERTGDSLSDEIFGILIGFAQCVKDRDGWVDIITMNQAEHEIKRLIDEETLKRRKNK